MNDQAKCFPLFIDIIIVIDNKWFIKVVTAQISDKARVC